MVVPGVPALPPALGSELRARRRNVLHILLLAGVYGGVDCLTNGLATALAASGLLKTTAAGNGPFTAMAIVTASSQEFPAASAVDRPGRQVPSRGGWRRAVERDETTRNARRWKHV